MDARKNTRLELCAVPPVRRASWAHLITALSAAGLLLLGAAPAMAKDLGQLLVDKGIITQEDLNELRKEAQANAAPTPTGVPPAAVVEQPPAAAAGAAAAATPSLDQLVKSEVQNELPDWLKHFKLSTLIYMDWAYYLKTGYGPQFMTQLVPPGPGNDGFNSFDLTRAYINLNWKPSDRFSIRITPNVFREIDTGATVNTSQSSSVATNVNGNLTYRLKYGYLQVNSIFDDVDALKDTPVLGDMNFRVGQMENPLIPWEEDMYGYRFVNLVPLNFLAYSSTDLGLGFNGPVTVDGVRYADYWLGVYNGSSFHATEFNEDRSPQGRVSVYPFAAKQGFENLGGTFFMSYGYTNVAPDTEDAVVRRIALLLHYSNKYGGIAFEWDRTRNENNFNNFFTAAAPPQSIPDPNNPGHTIPNPVAQLYTSILNPTAVGQGFNLFGHVNVWDWPVSVFAMWQLWYPNLDVGNDPLDFDRVVAGVAYQPLSWMRLAVASQNLLYFQSGPNVPDNTYAIFTNMEINY